MSERFRRNGARAWLLRVLGTYAVAAIVAAGIVLVSTTSDDWAQRAWSALLRAPALSWALNVGIVAAFGLGLTLVLAWLVRASRQEAAVNRLSALLAESAAPRDLQPLLEVARGELGRSAARERLELLAEQRRAGGRLEPSVLAEALLDAEDHRLAVARYAAGTLVLLGLLGTFVGLLLTIGGVSGVLDGLLVSPDRDLEAFLLQLKLGLNAPLEGMSIAFSTSLLGLSGSLVLGVGALGLSGAQSSWLSKLEQVTAIHFGMAPSPVLPVATPAVPGAGPSPPAAPSPVSDAGLARVEAAARLLHGTQGAVGGHLDRLETASSRMAGAVDDFRDRIAALAGQVERVEVLLTRLADAQVAGRETMNDLGVKLADLVGVAAAVRSDVRDGRDEIAGRIRSAADALRESVTAALAESARSAESGASSGVEAVQAAVHESSAARREEARETLRQLARIADVLEGSVRARAASGDLP